MANNGTEQPTFVIRLLAVILSLVVFVTPVIFMTGRVVARLDQITEDVAELKKELVAMKTTDGLLGENQKMVIQNQQDMLRLLRETRDEQQRATSPKH